MKTFGCDYEAPTFGTTYPDGRCIGGYMWDLDSFDGNDLIGGPERPCPHCNTLEYLDYFDVKGSGNSRQRRVHLREESRKCIAWARSRSTFNLV